MIHLSLVPSSFHIFCFYCFYNNTNKFSCQIGYNNVATNKFQYQNAICDKGPMLPFNISSVLWNGPFKECIPRKRLRGTSICNLTSITHNTISTICIGPHRRTHPYRCIPQTLKWFFYPNESDFANYPVMLSFTALGVIFSALTVVLNIIITFVLLKSKLLRTSNTVVYATHMAVIDLLIGAITVPMFLLVIYSYNQYKMKGKIVFSNETIVTLDIWLSRMDLIFLLAAFTNLAFMSIERCIVVVKPFWYMVNVTLKTVLLTVPGIWLYVLSIFFIYYYLLNNAIFSFFMGFVVPTVIMVVSSGTIIYEIKKVHLEEENVNVAARKRERERKVALKLLLLLIIFLCCWIPYFFVKVHYEKKLTAPNVNNILLWSMFRWTKLVSYCHCFIDSVLYAFARPRFRTEMKRILKINF